MCCILRYARCKIIPPGPRRIASGGLNLSNRSLTYTFTILYLVKHTHIIISPRHSLQSPQRNRCRRCCVRYLGMHATWKSAMHVADTPLCRWSTPDIYGSRWRRCQEEFVTSETGKTTVYTDLSSKNIVRTCHVIYRALYMY